MCACEKLCGRQVVDAAWQKHGSWSVGDGVGGGTAHQPEHDELDEQHRQQDALHSQHLRDEQRVLGGAQLGLPEGQEHEAGAREDDEAAPPLVAAEGHHQSSAHAGEMGGASRRVAVDDTIDRGRSAWAYPWISNRAMRVALNWLLSTVWMWRSGF